MYFFLSYIVVCLIIISPFFFSFVIHLYFFLFPFLLLSLIFLFLLALHLRFYYSLFFSPFITAFILSSLSFITCVLCSITFVFTLSQRFIFLIVISYCPLLLFFLSCFFQFLSLFTLIRVPVTSRFLFFFSLVMYYCVITFSFSHTRVFSLLFSVPASCRFSSSVAVLFSVLLHSVAFVVLCRRFSSLVCVHLYSRFTVSILCFFSLQSSCSSFFYVIISTLNIACFHYTFFLLDSFLLLICLCRLMQFLSFFLLFCLLYLTSFCCILSSVEHCMTV